MIAVSQPPPPTISVVIIFLNPGAFLTQAIDSVIMQSFADWELILVDDGSDDQSSQIAKQAAQERPHQVRYLEHAGHENRGTSASRDLGLEAATGEYLLYLDADDILFTDALAGLSDLARSSPKSAAVFGSVLFWFWASEFSKWRDSIQSYGRWVGCFAPPKLLSAMVRCEDLHPANCSTLLRTRVIREIGGFEPEFRGMYEDTVLLAKLMLEHTVLVTDRCFSAYRMHPASQCHRAAAEGSYRNGRANEARGRYLRWLKGYIRAKNVEDVGLEWAIRHELWAYDRPLVFRVLNSHKLRILANILRAGGRAKSGVAIALAKGRDLAVAALAQALDAQGRSDEAEVVKHRLETGRV